MPPKIYVYAVLFLVLVGFVKWGHTMVYNQGYNAHKAEIADTKDDADKKDDIKVKTIIKWRTKEKIVYRDKIKGVKNAKDITGCLDTKLSDMGVGL